MKMKGIDFCDTPELSATALSPRAPVVTGPGLCTVLAGTSADLDLRKVSDRVAEPCATRMGREAVYSLLAAPISDRARLGARQDSLAALASACRRRDVLQALAVMKACERDAFEPLYRQEDPDRDAALSMLYFTGPRFRGFNRNGTSEALALYNGYVRPLASLLQPAMYVIVPWVVLRLKYKVKMTLMAFVKMTFVVIMAVNKALPSWRRRAMTVLYAASTAHVAVSNINASATLRQVVRVAQTRGRAVSAWRAARATLESVPGVAAATVAFFGEVPAREVPAHRGAVGAYWTSLSDRDALAAEHRAGGVLDALMAVAAARRRLVMVAPRFMDESEDGPALVGLGAHHPLLRRTGPGQAFCVGPDKRVMVTGPNAAGKSTYMRNVMLVAIMAQTIGSVPCRECLIKPFGLFATAFRVSDATGGSSLFQAQLGRMTAIAMATEETPGLVAVDEPFGSTTVEEGKAAFRAAIGRVGGDSSVIWSTHNFKDLVDGAAPIRLDALVHRRGIKFPYRPRSGVSHQNIALLLICLNKAVDAHVRQTALQSLRCR